MILASLELTGFLSDALRKHQAADIPRKTSRNLRKQGSPRFACRQEG